MIRSRLFVFNRRFTKTLLPFIAVCLSWNAQFATAQVVAETETATASDSLAEGFTAIPAADHLVGAVFSVQLKGATSATLSYPVLEPLTREEARQVRELGKVYPETLQPEMFVGMERKQPVLEVSFEPFVERDGKLMRVTSVKITPKTTARAPRLQAESGTRYADRSVLAEGRWVKMHVDKEGVYRLTPEWLSQQGFSDPSRVKVYGYGGRILPEVLTFSAASTLVDDLCEVPLYRDGSNLLFFAEGVTTWSWDEDFEEFTHQQNPYSLYSYYFLTEGDAPLEFPTLEASTTSGTTLSNVWHHALVDNDAFAWFGGGRNFADSYDFASGASHSYTLEAPGAVSGADALVYVAFTAAGATSATPVSVSLGGAQLGSFSIPAFVDNESAREVIRGYATTALAATNTLTFSVGKTNPSRLDYIRATYKASLSSAMYGKSFSPCTQGEVTLQIADATAATQVWRIGEGHTLTARVPATLSGSTLTATVSDGLARYVIVDGSASYTTPVSDGVVANQNLHGDAAAYDMIIIVPKSGTLDEQAQRLATLHTEKDGLRVKMVHTDLLYNEFSSGTPDATAYRRYVKMLYDRAATDADAPRYLLLFGDCFYDNRGVTAAGKALDLNNFLLAYEPGTGYSTDFAIGTLNSYATDDYFGLLDDGEGLSIAREKTDVAIGRIPAHDAATAKLLVDKIVAYAQAEDVGAWRNRVVFAGDDIDNNIHMKGAETAIAQTESQAGSIVIKRVYPDAFKRVATATYFSYPDASARMVSEMEKGALMFNYTGHGGSSQISHARLLTIDDFDTHGGTHPALWTFAACEITPYDQQEEDLGRLSLFRPTGGAIALMCSSRAVYASYNSALNDAFCRYLFGKNADGRRYTMGEALQLCKNSLISTGRDATINKLKYVLLGDPALALALPTGSVVLDSIDGKKIGVGDLLQLKAGQVVRFSGHVETEGFGDGVVTATLFDRVETVTCLNNANSADTPMTYQERTSQLYEGSDSIHNGKFSFQAVIPRAISYTEDAARLVLYAVNTDRSIEAHGESTQFYLNGTDTSVAPDTQGPTVVPYLGDADFVNGGVVTPDVMFYATISDESGINTTSASVGHDMELVIDSNVNDLRVVNDYFQYDFGYYTQGTIAYPLLGLEDGHHTLTLRVWDVFDNSTTATLSFIVRDTPTTGISVFTTNNPAKSGTRIIVQGMDPESDAPVVIEAYDISGRRVWSREMPAQGKSYATVNWSLVTSGGAPVTAGLYILRCRQGGTESKGVKLIVTQ